MKLGQQVYWIEYTRDIPDPSYCRIQSVAYTIRWGRLKSVFQNSVLVSVGLWGSERTLELSELFESRGAASNKLACVGFRKSVGQSAIACRRPPPGWTCSRSEDHEGPCAATSILESSDA